MDSRLIKTDIDILSTKVQMTEKDGGSSGSNIMAFLKESTLDLRVWEQGAPSLSR